MPLTVRLNKILLYARDEAERTQSTLVTSEHLLLAILRLKEGVAYDLLVQAGVDIDTAFQSINHDRTCQAQQSDGEHLAHRRGHRARV